MKKNAILVQVFTLAKKITDNLVILSAQIKLLWWKRECTASLHDSRIHNKVRAVLQRVSYNTINQQTIRLHKINDAPQNDKTNSIRTSCLKMYYLFISAKHTYNCRNTHVCTLSSHNNINFTRSKTLQCLQYKLRMSNRCFILLASLHNNCTSDCFPSVEIVPSFLIHYEVVR